MNQQSEATPPPDPHKWVRAGEDTGGFVDWCRACGALRDSGGEIKYPHYPSKKDLLCEDMV